MDLRTYIQLVFVTSILFLGCNKESPKIEMPAKTVSHRDTAFEINNPQTWIQYRAPDNSFLIKMPAVPKVETNSLETAPLGKVTETRHPLQIQMGGTELMTYVYVYSDLPTKLISQPTSKILEAFRDSFLGPQAELRKESKITQQKDIEGLECEIYTKQGGGLNLTLRIFFVKNRVFVAQHGRNGNADPDAAKRYLDTFQILAR